MTSAIWNVTKRPHRTIFTPILTSRSGSDVIDQRLTASGNGQGAQEIGEVVRQRVQLQPHHIRLEPMAR